MPRAGDIPPVSAAEAAEFERTELDRFVATANAVPPERWSEPAGVPGQSWSIHDLVAHVAASYAALARLADLLRQADPRMLRLYRHEGDSLAQAIARVQIGDRGHRSPAELVRELAEAGPIAIEHRARLFGPLLTLARMTPLSERAAAIPLGPRSAVLDLWLHRLDLSEAAEQEMTVDSRHDRRILELMLRAAAPAAERAAGGRRLDLTVTTAAGGRWRYGRGTVPEAALTIDPIALAKHLARRRSPAATRERAVIQGDVRLAMRVLTAMQ